MVTRPGDRRQGQSEPDVFMEQTALQPAPEERTGTPETEAQRARLLALAVLALVLGAATGLVATAFRLALVKADHFRDRVLDWAHGLGPNGLLHVLVATASAAGLAAWMVRLFSPLAKGSGIPHVEAVLRGERPQAPFLLVPVKFVGGVLAMGLGLALGREGPSVQMGAGMAHVFGTVFRYNKQDVLALLAACAGAGLAVAFNAPIAGAVFVLEELVRRFDTRVTVATLTASAAAITVARVYLGEAPDFHVQPLPHFGLGVLPIGLVLGIVAGLLGIAYNRTLLGALAVAQRFGWIPVELRAALIGAGVGLLAWHAPDLVGGGEILAQRALAETGAPLSLLCVFLIRFFMGPISYAAETPGGLFAPMLVLGSHSGLLYGLACHAIFPGVAPPEAYAVVGMAAFFTAVVRAPVTGIVLVVELTAAFTLLLPMLAACAAAMVVPTLLGNPPIYDSLRMPAPQKPGNP
jgi:CIC family chloride channel protein